MHNNYAFWNLSIAEHLHDGTFKLCELLNFFNINSSKKQFKLICRHFINSNVHLVKVRR